MTRNSSYGAKLALLMALALAACSGSTGPAGTNGTNGANGTDGTAGAAGPQGPAGPVTLTAETCALCHATGQLADAAALHDSNAAKALARGTATILTADFTPSGAVVKPTITFQVRNAAGQFVEVPGVGANPATGWQAFNFTIAKLVPGDTATAPEHWQAFINSGTPASPSREAGGSGLTATAGSSLTYDAATHTYTYHFGTDINAVTAPVAVTYNPADTIRIGLQITNYSPTSANPIAYDMTNGVADFVPAGGTAPAAGLSREIVTTAACNACHGKLTVHGRRVEVNYCVTCHNAGLKDASGNVGDLTVFIHKLHGREVAKDATKAIFGGIVPDEITFPQNIMHCDTCHQGGAQSARWNTNPSRYACGSCHETIIWETGANHIGGAQPNDARCGLCHDSAGIVSAHATPLVTDGRPIAQARVAEEEAKKIVVSISSATFASGKLTMKFSIVNNANPAVPYKLTDPYFTQTGGASSLAAVIGFPNVDVTNTGNAVAYGQPLNINLLSVPSSSTLTGPDATDGSYTLVTPLPATATGQGTVAIQGHPAFLPPGFTPGSNTAVVRIPMKNASKAFAITGTASTARRTVVDIAKCNKCHANLSLHGNNRTGDITTCTICHNTEATDGNQRPNKATPGTTGVDGNLEQGIDFKYMIHSIHGTDINNGITVYGFGGSVNDFSEVKYPNVLSNCQACHNAGTYLQPAATANGTTTFSGTDTKDGADNLRTTKYAATCGACHAKGDAASHIKQSGGQFGVTQAAINALNP